MKTTNFLLATVFCFLTIGLNAQWVQLEPFCDYTLHAVFFTDANTGYVAGNQGTIAKTNDGGMNWVVQTVGENINIVSVHFPDQNTGYALGGGGIVLKTVDEGMNWSTSVIDSLYHLTDVYFTSVDTGYISGDYTVGGGITYGIILKTTNGGIDWTLHEQGGSSLRSVHFPSPHTGYVLGHSIGGAPSYWRMLKTVDAGQTWVHSFGTPALWVSSVFFINDTIGYTVGSQFLLKTTDGATNWISSDIGNSSGSTLTSVFFTDLNTGYITAWNSMNQGCIFQTNDGGENWDYNWIGDNALLAVHFPATDTGYVVGDMGDIFKTTNGGATGFNIRPGKSLTQSLFTFPNPFSKQISFKFTLQEAGKFDLAIYNSMGACVAVLINEYRQAGSHQLTWNATYLPPGLHFLRLQAGNEVRTGKIIKQ